jgi:hypothetical protein
MGEGGDVEPPADVGPAAEGAEGGARRVDEHGVVGVVREGEKDPHGGRGPCPHGPVTEPLERLDVDVECVYPAGALEPGGEKQGLPARAGAQIEEVQAGPGLDEGADQLAPLVLDLEEALLVGAEAEDVGSAVEVERVGGVPGIVARDALGPEPLGKGIAVEAKPVGPDGDRPGEVAGGGEERLRAQGALELGDQRVGPGEPVGQSSGAGRARGGPRRSSGGRTPWGGARGHGATPRAGRPVTAIRRVGPGAGA